MISLKTKRSAPRKSSASHRPLDLNEILQSLRLVLEMEPDHLEGAIDLLDEAIDIDRQKTPRFHAGR